MSTEASPAACTSASVDRQLPPSDYADLDQVTPITDYQEALEILRARDMRPSWGMASVWVQLDADGRPAIVPTPANAADLNDSDRSGAIRWDSLVQGHTALMRTHGPEHLRRRRAVNPLFGHKTHLWYRDRIVLPALQRNLADLMNTASSNIVRADLLRFSKRLFAELAGSLVGFDGVDTREGAESMLELHARMDDTRRSIGEMSGLSASDDEQRARIETMMSRSLEAKAELERLLYAPSLARRVQLVARQREGELSEEDLPRDFLTLVALGAGEFNDPGNPDGGFIMAFNLMSGATGTNTQTLLHAIDHLERWCISHENDRVLRTDASFIEHAVCETIRLRANGTIAIPRMALADVLLSSGREIKKGQCVAIYSREVNTDVNVFGPDAAAFNPHRVVPEGVYPYGLGFASGPHMCIGLPLVIGQGGITGTVVPTIIALYEAGLRLDPDRPPVRRLDVWPFRQEFAQFPVLFERER